MSPSIVNTPGLSPRGLDRLRRLLAGHVERGAAPGLVALVARGEQVHVETFGTLAVGDPRPMPSPSTRGCRSSPAGAC